jgi:O-antigen biosynthesis protein
MKISIIILTYNQLTFTNQCIESIEKHTKEEDIEIIVVDNASSDGTREYLSGLGHIRTIYNNENMGFARGCNQGFEISTGDAILFLNNDTVVTKNWLPPLIDLLYRNEKIGMVGPVSNYVSGQQQVHVTYQNIEDLDNFVNKYYHENKGKFKRVLRLIGFCLLVKREVLNKIGLFDEHFEIGQFEDDDLCLRAIQKGYQLFIAFDSFVHHYGHASFNNQNDIFRDTLVTNYKRFKDKWKIDFIYFSHPRPELTQLIPMVATKILDVGCGAGAIGLELLNHQECEIYGIELNSFVANLARNHYQEVHIGDVETIKLPYPESFFDTILFGNILEHLKDPWEILKTYAKFLKPKGSIICSIPNIVHTEVLIPLLKSDWHYVDEGILDRTHLRFFTPNSVHSLFPEDLFEVKSVNNILVKPEEKIQLFLNEVIHLGKQFDLELDHLKRHSQIYQILIVVEKK